jgi:hypothetical protein
MWRRRAITQYTAVITRSARHDVVIPQRAREAFGDRQSRTWGIITSPQGSS